jgi:hypothetical protein
VAMQPANVQTYVNEWVKTATGGNVVVKYAWDYDPDSIITIGRMRLHCKNCNQDLLCSIPEAPEKIDYALQKFVGLHRHAAFVPPTETSIVEMNKWGYVPISTKKINRATLKDEEGRRFRE